MGDAMRLAKSLYFQILCAVLLGVVVGHFWAQQAVALKPLGDAFIKLIKMMIAPVVFCTIVTGIAGMTDKRSLGRLMSKTLLLFLGLTVVSLVIGLAAVYLFKPGAGMNIDPATLSTAGLSQYTASAAKLSVVDFFMHIIPTPSSVPSTRVRCCRSCSSPYSAVSLSRRWAKRASRYWTCWSRPRPWCFASSAT